MQCFCMPISTYSYVRMYTTFNYVNTILHSMKTHMGAQVHASDVLLLYTYMIVTSRKCYLKSKIHNSIQLSM